jgi:hypothetical protein
VATAASRDTVVVLVCSHAVADQYCLAAWLRELLQTYARLLADPALPLPARLPLVMPQLPTPVTNRWASPIQVVRCRSSTCVPGQPACGREHAPSRRRVAVSAVLCMCACMYVNVLVRL